jgi:ribosomal protein S18 acetylase RimI-like enzyme
MAAEPPGFEAPYMNVSVNQIDSDVFGRCVLDLIDFDPACDFSSLETDYVARYSPVYVACKQPVEEVARIHALESAGFQFAEFQLRFRGTIGRAFDVSAHDYRYELVQSDADLTQVLEIAGTTFEHDRITRDPFLSQWNRPNLGGERYRRYVLKSMQAPDECVYQLVSNATGEIVGFGTHRMTGPDTALLLISGVKPEYKSAGIGVLLDQFAWNELKRKGVKSFIGHASGNNYPIINLVMRGIGFRLIQAFIVLRKVYPA